MLTFSRISDRGRGAGYVRSRSRHRVQLLLMNHSWDEDLSFGMFHHPFEVEDSPPDVPHLSQPNPLHSSDINIIKDSRMTLSAFDR